MCQLFMKKLHKSKKLWPAITAGYKRKHKESRGLPPSGTAESSRPVHTPIPSLRYRPQARSDACTPAPVPDLRACLRSVSALLLNQVRHRYRAV